MMTRAQTRRLGSRREGAVLVRPTGASGRVLLGGGVSPAPRQAGPPRGASASRVARPLCVACTLRGQLQSWLFVTPSEIWPESRL